MSAVRVNKRRAPLARQLKVRPKKESTIDDGFDVVECAMDIRRATANHRRDVDESAQACAAAATSAVEDEQGRDLRDKLTQLGQMLRILSTKYDELLAYTVKLEAATELAITSRHQYAMQIAAGDTESASDKALMSSVHR